jgi:hypothetical protein
MQIKGKFLVAGGWLLVAGFWLPENNTILNVQTIQSISDCRSV